MRGAEPGSSAISCARLAGYRPALRLALLGSTAILLSALLAAPSQANDECGTGASVVCDAGDAGYPTFPNGIVYLPVADLTLVVDSGAAIAPGSGIDGIHLTGGDNVDVTLEDGSRITTNGNSAYGVWIDSADSISVNSAASITTDGSNASAVFIHGTTGDVEILLSNDSSIETLGGFSQAVEIIGSTGSVVFLNEGTIYTGGDFSNGVRVTNSDQDVSIRLSSESSIETSGDRSRGLRISGTGGDVTLLSYGTIETSGIRSYGIEVNSNYGSVDVTASGAITTSGNQAHGIYLDYNYGSVSLNSSASITTSGEYAHGIYIHAAYEESIDITHAGHITTSGTDAHGIYVYGADWPSNPPGAPLSITTSAGSTITVSGNDAAGIRIRNGGDSITDVTLDLAGSIDVQGSGAAIYVSGTIPVTLDNAGSIKGDVLLGEGDDDFTNAGTLYTDEIDMGSGDDTLVNSGLIALSTTAGTIANVESFTHSGVIDLANGTAGDTLSISGDFISAGGALHMDAALATGTADRLTLGTVAPTSDPTFIYVTGLESGGTPASPILIIDAASDDSAGGAFVSAPLGAYQYELTYDPSLSNWYLGALGIYPGTAEYPALISGSLLAFASDLPALHERLGGSFGDGKDRIEPAAWTGTSPGLRPWIELTGARHEIDSDASYDLGVTKLRAGLDMAGSTPFANYSLGGFLGFGQARQEFAGSASEAESDLLQGGLYGGYRKGALYGQGLVKYEHHAAELESLSTAYDTASYAEILSSSVFAPKRYLSA